MNKDKWERLQYVEARFKQFLRANLKPDHIFVDVGANVGKYTQLAARYLDEEEGGRVYAFEPNLKQAMKVSKKVSDSGRENKFVTVYNIALGSTTGVSDSHISESSTGSSTHYRLENNLATVKIMCVALKDILSDIDIIKIDTEGAEADVIRGAAPLLGANKPIAVLVECHPHKGTPTSTTLDLLVDCGFSRPNMTNEDGLPPREDSQKEHIIALKMPEAFIV